jgi:hypothetical protein
LIRELKTIGGNMKDRMEIIKRFCEGANYYLVSYEKEFGKIINNNEISEINLEENEIFRSIEYKNNDLLFVLDLKTTPSNYVENPLQLLLRTLEDARAIEAVYPHIFTWMFNGLNIKAYAIVPSGIPKAHSTLSRYGGTENFYKVLSKHLKNISVMKKGQSPDFNFLEIIDAVPDNELAIGSINKFTGLHAIIIDLNMTYKDILKASKNFDSKEIKLNYLDIKYWSREVNPDFITEAKHIKLKQPIPISDEVFALYPAPIKRIMALKHKGNYNRFLISRFLLSVHSPKDAKFMYFSILGDEEREHVKAGNCSTQWNYVLNNMKRYNCPTLKEVSRYIHPKDEPLSHLLEPIQQYIDDQKVKESE